jgi:hypothetical protein
MVMRGIARLTVICVSKPILHGIGLGLRGIIHVKISSVPKSYVTLSVADPFEIWAEMERSSMNAYTGKGIDAGIVIQHCRVVRIGFERTRWAEREIYHAGTAC